METKLDYWQFIINPCNKMLSFKYNFNNYILVNIQELIVSNHLFLPYDFLTLSLQTDLAICHQKAKSSSLHSKLLSHICRLMNGNESSDSLPGSVSALSS